MLVRHFNINKAPPLLTLASLVVKTNSTLTFTNVNKFNYHSGSAMVSLMKLEGYSPD